MPTVTVKVRYSSTGGTPNAQTLTSVYVIKLPATESEVTAAIKQKNPKWNFVILEIRE